jgi:hypothetical protein
MYREKKLNTGCMYREKKQNTGCWRVMGIGLKQVIKENDQLLITI